MYAEIFDSEKKCKQSKKINTSSLCPSATSTGASRLSQTDMGGVSLKSNALFKHYFREN